jgi:hypothetical protein
MNVTALPFALLAAPLLAAAPARSQVLLTTESESQDGEVRDLATPELSSAPLDARRVWIAEGRVRAALRLADRERMPLEDRVFPLPDTRNQDVRALAVDGEAELLYTLTDHHLYRESFGAPWSQRGPGDQRDLPLPTPEPALDVQVIARGWCAVLTARRILVVESAPQGLVVRGTTPETFPLSTGGADPAFDALRAIALRRMTVAQDAGGDYVALCRVAVGGYGLAPRLSAITPYPQVLVACRLGRVADGFARPSFDFDSGPGLRLVRWDPFASAPAWTPAAADERAWHCLYDVDVRTLGSETRVYAACGRRKQVRELQLDLSAPGGFRELRTIPVQSSQDLFYVRCDPRFGQVLHVQGSTALYTVDSSTNAPSVQSQPVPVPIGGLGEVAFAGWSAGAAQRVDLWTAGAGTTESVLRVFDVTAAVPRLRERVGGLWRSDGAVALGPDDVYTPTWGGVEHYRRVGGRWTPVEHQPTNVPGPTGMVYATEHIALAEVAPGDRRVLIAANHPTSHGLLEMRVSAEGELLPAAFHTPRAFLQAVGWDPRHQLLWTNDVAPFQLGGASYALIDIANDTLGRSALLAYRYAPATGSWDVVAWCVVHTPGPDVGLSNAIDVAQVAADRAFAFVGHDAGFYSVDLGGLRSTPPSIRAVSTFWTPPGIAEDRHVCGLAAAGDRLIVCFNNRAVPLPGSGPPSVPPEPSVKVFRWDRADGQVAHAPERVYHPTDPSDPLHHDGYRRTFRCRFLPDAPGSGDGKLFVCDDGWLFEWRVRASAQPLAPLGAWKGAYSSALQDARAYDFGAGPRVLVSKDSEAFAWVVP